MAKEPAALPWMQTKKAAATSANNSNASSANATLKGSNTSSGGVSSADSERTDAARADVAGAGVISSKSPAAHKGISPPAPGPRRGVGDVVFALLRDVASEDDPDGARVFKGWYPCVVRGTQNDSVSFVFFTTVCLSIYLSVILSFFLLFSTQPRNTTPHHTTQHNTTQHNTPPRPATPHHTTPRLTLHTLNRKSFNLRAKSWQLSSP
jgi:hypothetical protein